MGDPRDFGNFVNAVIDEKSYETIKGFIEKTLTSSDAEVIIGGNCDKSKGYFIEPTVILASDPKFLTMQEEIFGPVVSIYVYGRREVRGDARTLRPDLAPTPSPARSSPTTATPPSLRSTSSASPQATSTSTTNPPAPWSVCSPSAARALPAPTTRPAVCKTSCAGSALAPSKRRIIRRVTIGIRF